jgi:Novel toxin 15
MSALKPILRELKDAALKGGAHAKDKLHQLTDNLDGHLDDIIRRVRDNDRYDGTVDVSLRRFTRNRNHDSAEYDRQYNEQMDTLQNMTAADWVRNRIDYLENGRTSDSLRAQQDARDDAMRDMYDDLRDQGLSPQEAQRASERWLTTQAATHRLDGIAGGDVTDISGVGDSRINSSLGSQWRTRVGDIDRAIVDYVDAHPGVDLHNVFVNVTLR